MKRLMASRHRIALVTMAVVAVVAIAVAVFLWSSGETRAQFGGLLGSITPVESKIGYQGQLTDSGGQLLTGNYTMKFRLYNADVGGSQLGSEMDKGTVAVSQGLFSVELPVDASHFDGQALWLEVQVGTEVLSPRQEILPVPYALHTLSPPGPCQKFDVPQLTPAEIIALEEAGQLPVYHVVDVPDFCIDGICQIWVRYHDENAMGALATPGVLGPCTTSRTRRTAAGSAAQTLPLPGCDTAAAAASTATASLRAYCMEVRPLRAGMCTCWMMASSPRPTSGR